LHGMQEVTGSIPVFSTALRGSQQCGPFIFNTGADDPDFVGMSAC